ncbi:hypothetical protein VNO77_34503 [Canavalia gladiata]|uniref:Uncharacterized protein n=1 Tax=Canavalia gladiata TaxID=3824 RepID=A0AAN9PYK9_CANGL
MNRDDAQTRRMFDLDFDYEKQEKENRQKKVMGSETFLEVILAILLPPVGVFLRYGCGVEFWIDVALTVLGYIPGMIYAIYVLVA